VHPPLRELLRGELPQELAIPLAKTEQTAEIDAVGISLEIGAAVIRADKYPTIGNNRCAISLAS